MTSPSTQSFKEKYRHERRRIDRAIAERFFAVSIPGGLLAIVIALCYLPSLALICGLSGVVAQGFIVKSHEDKVLANWTQIAAFVGGAVSGSMVLAAMGLLLSGSSADHGVWDPLFNQIAASLILPPVMGVGISRLSIELAKIGAASSVVLNRFALGIFQSIWLFPAILVACTFPLRGILSAGTGMLFAIYLPVFFVLAWVAAGLAKLTLKPVFPDKFS